MIIRQCLRAFQQNPLRPLRSPVSRRLASTSTPPLTIRLSRLESRLPRFLRHITTPLRTAPLSHITAFLLLHELTAILPLLALATAFHQYDYLPPYISEGKWVKEGTVKFGGYMKRKGWIGEEGSWWGTGEGAVRVVVEIATAWAVVKLLLPVRLVVNSADFQEAIDGIAEICAKNRMSLAEEHTSHMPPVGEITGAANTVVVKRTPHAGRPNAKRALTIVPEGSSSGSERSKKGSSMRIFDFSARKETTTRPRAVIRIGSMGRSVPVASTTSTSVITSESVQVKQARQGKTVISTTNLAATNLAVFSLQCHLRPRSSGMEKYRHHLRLDRASTPSAIFRVKRTLKQVDWAVAVQDDVAKLKTSIAPQLAALGLLFQQVSLDSLASQGAGINEILTIARETLHQMSSMQPCMQRSEATYQNTNDLLHDLAALRIQTSATATQGQMSDLTSTLHDVARQCDVSTVAQHLATIETQITAMSVSQDESVLATRNLAVSLDSRFDSIDATIQGVSLSDWDGSAASDTRIQSPTIALPSDDVIRPDETHPEDLSDGMSEEEVDATLNARVNDTHIIDAIRGEAAREFHQLDLTGQGSDGAPQGNPLYLVLRQAAANASPSERFAAWAAEDDPLPLHCKLAMKSAAVDYASLESIGDRQRLARLDMQSKPVRRRRSRLP
ncbi:hypothetical protein B0A48_01008 [Cryoendolithus antarcticus]|uniref:Uncharacterized protein n=1 Tax=Cryoendolithus antarcticus TaxID=1507870 RepID=A0A1V8TSG0_9PEZI|nr:hypothetical protein B0A48_01008 [Cryoendolithus antarcticus]